MGVRAVWGGWEEGGGGGAAEGKYWVEFMVVEGRGDKCWVESETTLSDAVVVVVVVVALVAAVVGVKAYD